MVIVFLHFYCWYNVNSWYLTKAKIKKTFIKPCFVSKKQGSMLIKNDFFNHIEQGFQPKNRALLHIIKPVFKTGLYANSS